ncbi:hypothetical protein JX265_009378 [Neoarthrinium moseri]|uniref:N-acetyltransferase domain-containing protein n=1 Tax=Neoarthrinium moseri TaxID=1658444 RepID=A0A9Q0AJC5_9PEZI|nr:hypothetical protein JX266_013639 [Neoarthrinium moseri]KAI1861875.1 hypothetical protein JX265_009378 [Neoarthrinium moseri]
MFDGVPLGEYVDASPARQPEPVTLEGSYVTLVPLVPSHAPALYEQLCVNSPEATWAYMSAGPFTDLGSFTTHISNFSTSRDPLFFTVLPRQDIVSAKGGGAVLVRAGTPAGYVSLMRIDARSRAVEVGHITLGAALQRTRPATEALFLVLRHCLAGLGFRRVEWKCDALNARSRRAAARYGFVPEGVFRRHMIVRGRNRDTAWFSIVDGEEWEARREAFEKWLDPGNFDERGQQKKKLEDFRG